MPVLPQIKVPEVGPSLNLLAQIPAEMREAKRQNLLTGMAQERLGMEQERLGMAQERRAFDLRNATAEQKRTAMNWVGSLAYAAKGDPAKMGQALETIKSVFPTVPHEMRDLEVAGQKYGADLAGKMALKTQKTPSKVEVADEIRRRYGEQKAEEYLTSTPGTNVDIRASKPGEKIIAAWAGKVGERAEGAMEKALNYKRIHELIGANPDVYTGSMATQVQALKKLGQTFLGLNIKGVGAAEVAEQIRVESLGPMRKMIGDVRMSDADRRTYLGAISGLPNSAEGIALSAELAAQAADFAYRSEQKMMDLATEAGEINWDVKRKHSRWERTQRMFDPGTIRRAQDAAKKTKRKAPSAGMENVMKKYGLEARE